MTVLQIGLLFMAALLGGALNSVAGGGSFICFPALLFSGVPGTQANMTSTVALWPGSLGSVGAYRQELRSQGRHVLPLLLVSLAGGVIGAVLLVNLPSKSFEQVLPFLMLFATILFAFGRRVAYNLQHRASAVQVPARVLAAGTVFFQLLVAIYGGFFGGGIGIIMLALLSLRGLEHIHQMNALKSLLSACINGIAILIFVAIGGVLWPQALTMIAGGLLGGYGGARYARQVSPAKIQTLVSLTGALMTIIFFARAFLSPSL